MLGNDDDDLYGGFGGAPAANSYGMGGGTMGGMGGYGGPVPMYGGMPPSGVGMPTPVTPGMGMIGAGYNPLMGRPPAAMGMQTGGNSWGPPPGSGMGRQGTSSGTGGGSDARPMTSNRGAGYTAHGRPGGTFDPLNQGKSALSGPAPPLQKRGENSPEELCGEMERKVNSLIEESAILASQGDVQLALERAKEAAKRERQLCKQRENLQLTDQINIDLTYSVQFNLAVQYHKNGLHVEAINIYNIIVKNTKQFPQAGQLRVNMGNIYAEQKKYTLAIKMYRTALEVIPTTAKDLRFKIMRNIGNAFVKMGEYQNAIGAYESIMDSSPDMQTGFNLLLCYYALGDGEKMKRHFAKLLSIKVYGSTEEGDAEEDDDADHDHKDVIVDDVLRAQQKERRSTHLRTLLTAARLIAPVVEKDWQSGFDSVIEQLKQFEVKDASSRLASELEMCKYLNYLKERKYGKAIEGLKAFEKKDKALRARAATNLSYLYFLEGEFDSGEKYANMSVETDKYNSRALVNKGNFYFIRGEHDKARDLYMEALSVEADCVEAIYNMALAHKKTAQYEEALRLFKRLHNMVDSVEVLYHIADLYEILGDPLALEWFNRLIGRVPTDPQVLARVGALYAKENDEAQAFHYHLDSYRHYQVNMDVISWLGAYFVKNEVYEKAIQFFERASQIQPTETKWLLMVASCHRRIGQYQQARTLYEDILKRQPDNADCLRYLVHLLNDLNLKDEATEYFKRLKRLEARTQLDTANTMGGGDGEAPTMPDITVPRMSDDADSPPMAKTGGGASSVQKTSAKYNAPVADDDTLDDDMLPGT